MERINKVTFVCQANINRSPAAQYIAETMAARRGLGVEFTSAGLIEPSFLGLSFEMARALRELEYQLPEQHIPTRVTPELLQRSDLVLCFERDQVGQIRAFRGGIRGNVYTLPEYAGFPQEEIPDPHQLIRKTLSSTFIRSLLPGFFRPPFYNMIGYVHPADEREVLEIHVGLALQIERYVEQAIEKIAITHLEVNYAD